MTADDPTHADSDNSIPAGTDDPLGTDPDAQHLIETLQRSGGTIGRRILITRTQLPAARLDAILARLEAAGLVDVQQGFTTTRIELTSEGKA